MPITDYGRQLGYVPSYERLAERKRGMEYQESHRAVPDFPLQHIHINELPLWVQTRAHDKGINLAKLLRCPQR